MVQDELAIRQIEQTPDSFQKMVLNHYDNPKLTELEGEITFDDELSKAEVTAALRAYTEITGKEQIPPQVYLPMAGPLRHVMPLLEAGVTQTVAVDLSKGSFDVGFAHYGDLPAPDGLPLRSHVADYKTDIRNIAEFAPAEGFELAISLGNSFGDVTDPEGHRNVLQALADALQEGGALVFDYVGTRYNPPAGITEISVWDDFHVDPETGTRTPVKDTRTRTFEPMDEEGNGILKFTCHVQTVDEAGNITGGLVPKHPYEKLTLTEGELHEQFAAVGLRLIDLGPMTDYSDYHRQRVDTLGMMGKPDHLYIAVKDSRVQGERKRHASTTN